MTIGTDISRRVSRLFGDTDKIFVVDADYIDFINDAQRYIARATECLTTVVTPAASTFPWSFPADFIKIKRLVYGQVPMNYIDIEDLDAKSVNLTDRATPQFFYVDQRKINLFPLQPSADTTVVTVEYANIPATISALANTITIPDIYLEEIVNFVLAKTHSRNENYRAEEAAIQQVNAGMARDMDNTFQPDDTYPIVRDDPIDVWYM